MKIRCEMPEFVGSLTVIKIVSHLNIHPVNVLRCFLFFLSFAPNISTPFSTFSMAILHLFSNLAIIKYQPFSELSLNFFFSPVRIVSGLVKIQVDEYLRMR